MAIKFANAHQPLKDPADQAVIPEPRIGFSGVIDERFDSALIQELADRRPEWQFIFLGPVVKIDPNTLPKRNNVHFLGMKSYNDLPAYFSHWQVALLPFALNKATRFISPTKTPEYLAAGLPVISTPIYDVVHDYDRWDYVFIEKDARGFEKAIDQALCLSNKPRQIELDQWLKGHSWDKTWQRMHGLIRAHLPVNMSARGAA